MKNSVIILLLATISIFSCKKEEVVAPTPEYNNIVVGNYQVIRLDLNGKIYLLPNNTVGVSAGVSVKTIFKNRVQATLTVQSASGKVPYTFLASDLSKEVNSESILFINPILGNFKPSTKQLNLSGVTESGETIKIIATTF